MAVRAPNPFRPGFNQSPLVLSGRDRVLGAIDEAFAVAGLDGRTPRPIVLTGPRGVGKTVILGEAAARVADNHAWLTAPVEVRSGKPFTPQLIERLVAVRDLYRQTRKGSRVEVTGATVRASVLGVGGEVVLTRNRAAEEPVHLESALAEACAAAEEHRAGVLVTVDELQLASKSDLAEFAAALQQHVPDNWPLVVLLAGLPNARGTQRGVTYLERGEWHSVGLLSRVATLEALRRPAEAAGRPLDDDAAQILADASGDYPYAVQLMGHHAWRVSTGATRIDASAAQAAVQEAQLELTEGLYASRWDDATELERDYLSALAEITISRASATGAAVAERLGKTPRQLSYLRDRLIQRGTIFTEGRVLRFAIPGFAEWMVGAHPQSDRED